MAAAASLFGGAPAANAGEDGVLQRLCRHATPATIVALMNKARTFSAEMKTALGVSIIDDSAVDLLQYVALRLRDSVAPVHAPHPSWGPVAPPPPMSAQPPPPTALPVPGPEASGGGNGRAHDQDAIAILSALAAAYASDQVGLGVGNGGGGSRAGMHPQHAPMGP